MNTQAIYNSNTGILTLQTNGREHNWNTGKQYMFESSFRKNSKKNVDILLQRTTHGLVMLVIESMNAIQTLKVKTI